MLESYVTGFGLNVEAEASFIFQISHNCCERCSCLGDTEKVVTPIICIGEVKRLKCAGGRLVYDGSLWICNKTDILAHGASP